MTLLIIVTLAYVRSYDNNVLIWPLVTKSESFKLWHQLVYTVISLHLRFLQFELHLQMFLQ